MTYEWLDIANILTHRPAQTFVRVEKHQALHPRCAGFTHSIGIPRGQSADFRLTLSDCRGLHVQDFGTHYEAHIDQVDPACGVVDHLAANAPEMLVAAGAGALVGLALGRSGGAALLGLFIGGSLGLAYLSSQSRPAT